MGDGGNFSESTWHGGFYELAIEVGPRDDARLQRALTAVWSAADVQGCYGDMRRAPGQQESVGCTVESLTEFGHVLGQVRLPTGQIVACGCMTIREEGDDPVDWLDFYLPIGALDEAGFDIERAQSYRSPVLDDWLAAIGTAVFHAVDFHAAFIGFETSGCSDAATLGGELPESRRIGYLLPVAGELRYGPANDGS
ncbi:hypothetical protein [Streptomyces sp. NBC_01565]|uniref:hypothetical protein n=1 Tax=Streptomyces sp. NBC_01565 TaxID=2975881 RepID=UPI00225B54FA|nr:hypothetical protein [Streptomyces sp. NBC_01565]MCX4539194.1 hypothetical protein [Streptomyces sp. NBC_01565]